MPDEPKTYTPASLWAEKYAERFELEKQVEGARREQAFLEIPFPVCGEMLRLMTPRDLLLLNGCGNCFVCGGEEIPEHAAMLLWVLNSKNDGTIRISNTWRKYRMIARVRGLEWDYVRKSIREYIDEVFQDSPDSGGSNESERKPIGTCFLAPLLIRLCRNTGWSESDVLALPLPRAFQYLRAIDKAKAKDGNAPYDSNPSDSIRGEFLDELNELMHEGLIVPEEK